MHHRSPATECVTVDGVEQALRQHFEQLLGLHVGSVQGLAHAVQIRSAGARHDKVCREHRGAYQIQARHERRAVLAQTSDHRLREPGTEPKNVMSSEE